MRRGGIAFSGAALLLASIALGETARADDLRIEVFADRTQAAADELIRLTYKISGGLSGDVQPPSPLPLRNLTLAGGPSQ